MIAEGMYMSAFALYMTFAGTKWLGSGEDAYDSIIRENFKDGMPDEENLIRIAMSEDKAYWVYENVLYETDIVDGEIDRSARRPYDAMDKPISEIISMMDMLDSLKVKGERNESSSAGDEGVPEL